MARSTSERPSARARLLAAADELFYEEGVRTVGIDRVIERAGVAKGTLYNTFGSKDELVRSYLTGRHALWKERIAQELAERYRTPRERLLAMFDSLGRWFAEPGFRGCAFINASGEARPGSTVEQACDEFRAWVRSLFAELTEAAGYADPERLSAQLVLLYDGATVAARLDRNPRAADVARDAAVALLDASAGPGRHLPGH
ncbi:TetR/AcrR family transcriptional regulator [Actinomadura scrupuli]|uniref:TetR/AcrR family transcriptional regulator n=1 Tax=Actinomadura scrupuli TaxID=559629 RepID=UPI003D980A7C